MHSFSCQQPYQLDISNLIQCKEILKGVEGGSKVCIQPLHMCRDKVQSCCWCCSDSETFARMNDAGPGWLDGQDVRNGSHLRTFEPCNKTINRWREPITLIISEKMTTGKTLILKHHSNRGTNWNINYVATGMGTNCLLWCILFFILSLWIRDYF